ncbi:MAG: hypothetical protein ACREO8_02220 [Luteimonas sp.]
MIEAIQVAAIDPAQAASAATPAAQPQATAFEVSQFAEAYARGAAAPTAAAAVANTTPAQPSQGMRGVMSALDNLNGGAEGINSMSQTMSANSSDMTPSQMMDMTMKCHQFLFKAELTSNVANRTSDGISQLFRQQS